MLCGHHRLNIFSAGPKSAGREKGMVIHMNPEPKKVRTLLRVSSRQQLHDDDIPVQRAEAAQYISGRPDWKFDKEYIEKAVSAYKNSAKDREVLMEILADAEEGRFDILLTYMSDRIGRQEEYSFYVAALNRLGIEVWTIKDGQLKTEEHIDKLLNYIRFWQNEGESKKTGMRVRDHQAELVKSGKFVGGKAPFGYRLIPSGMISNHGRLLKKLEIVEKDAEVVKKIYHLAIRQGMGYSRIANALNAEGIPPIAASQWKPSTIASILKNPIYMGYYALNRRIHHDSFTRLDRKDWIYSREQIPELVIINKQDWEKAQEIREARKAGINASKKNPASPSAAPSRTSGRLPLIGLAFCGYCGKKLKNGSYYNHWQTKSGEKKVSFTGRYLCPEKCALRSCYSQRYLECAVWEAVEKYLGQLKSIDLTEDFIQMQIQYRETMKKGYNSLRKDIKALQADISTLEEKIPSAIRGDYCFGAEKLSSILEEKEATLKELQQQEKKLSGLIRLEDSQKSFLKTFTAPCPDWKAEFRQADNARKQMLLYSLIDAIFVKDGDITIHFKIHAGFFMESP